jgi:hypothetical protein
VQEGTSSPPASTPERPRSADPPIGGGEMTPLPPAPALPPDVLSGGGNVRSCGVLLEQSMPAAATDTMRANEGSDHLML